MNTDLPFFENEIHSLLREYLVFAGMEKTSYALQNECKEKGKTLPAGNSQQADGSKLAAQNNILLEFDAGQYQPFWKLWEDHVPTDIRTKDYTCQRLEFYIQIHFAVYPIRISSLGEANNQLDEGMTRFKKYLETSGSSLSQTTEFLPFYALPFVSNPIQHPSFKDLFTPNWIPELRARVERFLSAALNASEPPILIKLVKNKERLLLDEDVSSQANTQLQQQLVQAERRCGVYMKRFNKLQSDYHILISITAELVDSLEQTVHGRMVTVEYLQSVCARLFNSKVVGNSANIASMDFTRPGTASSLLRASIAPDNIHEAEDVALLPSLDYTKLKRDFMSGPIRTKALLLQALRWRLTRSLSGEQRETVVDAFIANDLFGCRSQTNGYSLINLLKSPDSVVRQYTARLYNAITSLQKGRSYLCSFPMGVRQLLSVLTRLDDETDRLCKEHLLGCLQKLSLRRSLQTVMIEGDLIAWLVTTLSGFETLSDYMLEYAIALLMNLCLRSSGKRKCGDLAEDVLRVLSKLLAHENSEIRPYVNGALYSVLSNPVVRYVAQDMGLEDVLRDLMEGEQAEFKRQLEFIIRQLNAGGDSHNDNNPDNDSDDDNDEDDDEDQDAMEADLDKDEVLQLRPRELSGEKFLCSEYLGIMTNSQPANFLNPAIRSVAMDGGIPQRPLTPSHHRTTGGGGDTSQLHSGSMDVIEERIENMSLSMSYPSTLVSASETMKDSRPPTSAGSRPGTGTKSSLSQNRLKSSGKHTGDGSRPTSTSSVRSGGSRSIRKLPGDKDSSKILAERTGVIRNVAPPINQDLPQPSVGMMDTDPEGIKEYTTVFSSRPRILRTPDVSNLTPRGAPPPLNPTYSYTEPRSRPSSSSSWRGSKGSSGNTNVNSHMSDMSSSSRRQK
uniref:lisH domain-containing protein ARMC9-like n=1 Tax=Styela clava TaxID=7725 RepID=UPI00193A2D09|nr:lisH domain-containing protein ARMC9-like [Styela clava]